MWNKSSKGIGIVIENFSKEGYQNAIDLLVCDRVMITEECPGWYRGYLLADISVKGIFPSAYVHITSSQELDYQSHKSLSGKSYREDRDTKLLQELTETLREWSRVYKHHFKVATGEMLCPMIQKVMLVLIEARRNFMMPDLTADQKLELAITITQKLDWGNKTLCLDFVPRWQNGDPVDADSVSPVELYKIHQQMKIHNRHTEGIERGSGSSRLPKKVQLSHHLYLKVMTLMSQSKSVTESQDDIEAYFTLYDASDVATGKFITERTLCKIDREGRVVSEAIDSSFCSIFVDLTTEDLSRDAFLLAYVYRVGALKMKDSFRRTPGRQTVLYKKPYGCAVLSIQDILQKQVNRDGGTDGGNEHFMPLFLYNSEKDDVQTMTDGIIKKLRDNKIGESDATISVQLDMFHGDIATVKQEHPLLFSRYLIITQKLGFADTIAPVNSACKVLLNKDVRNDFYLNLLRAEFDKMGKSAEKNVEARVVVVKSDGDIVQDCLWPASGQDSQNEYRSAVFYHNNFPKWNEVIRMKIAPDLYHDCHIRIEFRHCSRQAAEKRLLGFCYLPLCDSYGNTVQDHLHDLYIYKFSEDHVTDIAKKGRPFYLELAYEAKAGKASSAAGCEFSNKYCSVVTTLTSTVLTQDENLLAFFKWQEMPQAIDRCLENIRLVRGDEIMRFHHHILNTLFGMSCDLNGSKQQPLIFKALVHILKFPKEKTHEQFLPLIEQYINETFCAPIAHREMMDQLVEVICSENNDALLAEVINVMDLLFKFIVQSALLYAKEKQTEDFTLLNKGMNKLWTGLQKIFRSSQPNPERRKLQARILECLVDVFSHLIKIFPAENIAESFSKVIQQMPKRDSEYGEHKLKCLSKIVSSKLFDHAGARKIILELCSAQLEFCFLNNQDMMTASQNLSDILIAISRQQAESILFEKELIISKLLDVVATTILSLQEDRSKTVQGQLLACLITMLWWMDSHGFAAVLPEQTSGRLKDFLSRMFHILTDIVSKSVFQEYWVMLLMVTNKIVLNSCERFSPILLGSFVKPFAVDLWTAFFILGVSFITQPCLQLEQFSASKRTRLLSIYGDLRLSMCRLLLSLWNQLGDYWFSFIPSLIGHFLKASLLPVPELRTMLLPVFYDMMLCWNRRSGNFSVVEEEMVDKLDFLINENQGDETLPYMFETILTRINESELEWKAQSSCFIKSLISLSEKLIDYRNVVRSADNKESHMMCTVGLIQFYDEVIKRDELYKKYVYKLCQLHEQCENYTEAGFTLLLLARRLDWSLTHLQPDSTYPGQKAWERKEALYQRIIRLFDVGASWENAIPLCKELNEFYETRLFDFVKLRDNHQELAAFYDKILNGVKSGDARLPRMAPGYFRVGFFGKTFPLFVRNKVFVYRAKPCEKLDSVIKRLKSEFPAAELHKNPYDTDVELLEGNSQYLQVLAITPVAESLEIFSSAVVSPVCDKITSFYQDNAVKTFQYDRGVQKGEKDKNNEFKTLWLHRYTIHSAKPMPNILCWFEVVSSRLEVLTPLQNAVETIISKNKAMRKIIDDVRSSSKTNATSGLHGQVSSKSLLDAVGVRAKEENRSSLRQVNVGQLSAILKGTVDAVVMGGIGKYKEAFLTKEYAAENPDHADNLARLRRCFAEQLKLAREGLILHKELVTDDMKPFHDALEGSYHKLKETLSEPDADVSVQDSELENSRPSSGYSSSDIEMAEKKDDKHSSIIKRGSRISGNSSTGSLNSTADICGSPKKNLLAGKLSNEQSPTRSSLFYCEVPKSSSPQRKESEQRNDGNTSPSTPHLPPKRASSFNITSKPVNFKNRPLPAVPQEEDESPPVFPRKRSLSTPDVTTQIDKLGLQKLQCLAEQQQADADLPTPSSSPPLPIPPKSKTSCEPSAVRAAYPVSSTTRMTSSKPPASDKPRTLLTISGESPQSSDNSKQQAVPPIPSRKPQIPPLPPRTPKP